MQTNAMRGRKAAALWLMTGLAMAPVLCRAQIVGAQAGQIAVGRGVPASVSAAWAGAINGYFSSPNPDPAALTGVLYGLEKIDLNAPAVRESLAPVAAQVRLAAQGVSSAGFALKSTPDESLVAAEKLDVLNRELRPFLTGEQQAQAREAAQFYQERLSDENRARLAAKMRIIADALGRSSEESAHEFEESVSAAADPSRALRSVRTALSRLEPVDKEKKLAAASAALTVHGPASKDSSRKDAKEWSRERYTNAKQWLSDRLLVLYDLESRLPSKESAEKLYSGETLTAVKSRLNDVDDLFILSGEVERVLQRAESLLKESSAGWGLSAKKNREVLDLLSDKPIDFGAEAVVQNSLGGDATWTFRTLVEVFRLKAVRALETAGVLSKSVAALEKGLGEMRGLDSMSDTAQAILQKGQTDPVGAAKDLALAKGAFESTMALEELERDFLEFKSEAARLTETAPGDVHLEAEIDPTEKIKDAQRILDEARPALVKGELDKLSKLEAASNLIREGAEGLARVRRAVSDYQSVVAVDEGAAVGATLKEELRKARVAFLGARFLEAAALVKKRIDVLDEGKMGIAARFIKVNPGTFQMGSPDGPNGEKDRWKDEVQHMVTLTHPFELQAADVTQEQFLSLMGRNPSNFGGSDRLKLPVEQVTFYDAVEYANALSKLRGLKPAYEIIRDANGQPTGVRVTAASIYETEGYRLPTEAELQYATRAGTQTPYPFEAGQLDRNGWHSGNSGGQTHAVGTLLPNAWGFYDLVGNVWKWTHDWWGDHTAGAVTDPEGPATGSNRVVRGGSWSRDARYLRSAVRFSNAPGNRDSNVGFRLSRSIR